VKFGVEEPNNGRQIISRWWVHGWGKNPGSCKFYELCECNRPWERDHLGDSYEMLRVYE